MEDHSLVHLMCTGAHVQAGNSPTISTDYAQQAAVDHMLSKWHIMSQRKSYIGSNFVCLYDEAKNPLVPTHLKGGPWIWLVMTSSDLTGHAPIGSYYKRFLSHTQEPLLCLPLWFPLRNHDPFSDVTAWLGLKAWLRPSFGRLRLQYS
jgi:hypothetical protein